MSTKDPKPREARIQTRFEALYSTGRREGAGVLVDISYTGALFHESSIKPELGTEVRAFVFVMPINPFEISGQVVRHTEDGFAIEYKDLDPIVRALVDDARAIVSAPH